MRPRTVAVIAIAVLLLGAAPFAVSSTTTTATIPFEDTKPTGLSDRAVQQVQDSTLVIPRAEAFYTQYRYVVGYYGVTSLVAGVQTQREREVGRPLAIYVTSFSGSKVRVGDDGYLRMPDLQVTEWIPARNAYFVVNSSARVPEQNTTIIPFSTRADAEEFANKYGGTVHRWGAVKQLSVGRAGRTVQAWQRVAERRTARTDEAVASARTLLDRPVSVTVGEDAPTVTTAVRQAPPNSTIIVPPGTYQVGSLTISKPLTIRGSGPEQTHLVGDKNGSVIVSSAPRTAISGVSISGVGPKRSGKGRNVTASVEKDSWKYRYYKVHGYGDAAIVFDDAARSLVSDVRINTTSNGVLARTSRNVVVMNLSLYGTERWEDGFLGVSTVGARIIVQDSQFYGGKVGVYAYDAPQVVVRNTTATGMMVGVFDLFSPKLVARNNTIDDVWNGIYAETRSYGNVVVGNRVHNSYNGIIVEGRSNFVARNVLLHNRKGAQVHGQFSVYWRNVFAFNRIGAESGALLPFNRVRSNDFVGNRQYVTTQDWNVLHVWEGNYWAGAPGLNRDRDRHRHLDRAFRPSGPVDGRMATTTGAPTLARSPALASIRQLQQLMPGLRGAGVVDTKPLARPVRSRTIESVQLRSNRTGQHTDPDPWEYVS
ncbi:right-handed parallel beta-helix repeat-containing protein [Halorarius litoreus]|jgi:nitrous oxidase accessory protein NosD|uniref:right-handed parallel beta-helix repeat-containing protein n=1 Tax=Halorarius litoreus TaxID=2962676 RepID=UPI0020CC0DD8|nr:right-handed parallel beta-helix repeat-containing protein [Halorarius litoreus]